MPELLVQLSRPDGERTRQYGRQIGTEVERLAALTERALAFAGLASGQARRERLPVAVAAIVQQALDEQARVLGSAQAQVTTRLRPVPPVVGDAAELRQAVGNLLANAAKFAGPSPRIEVGLEHAAGAPRPVRLRVRDHGPGIPPDEQRRIFQPFVRGSAALDAQIPGSGLGLFLVQEAVRAAGGRIDLDSRLGQGAVFTLSFPAAGPERPDAA